jgi:hypothetical protein
VLRNTALIGLDLMIVKSTNLLARLPFRFYIVRHARIGMDTSSFVTISFNKSYFKELFCNDK